MKDPSVGSFGSLALSGMMLLKWIAVLKLVQLEAFGLVVAGVILARWVQVILASALPYARSEGGTAREFVNGAGWPHMVVTTLLTLLFLVPFLSAEPYAFGAALMEIQAINQEGGARAGNPDPSWVEEQRVWAVMRESGALAWGRSAAGQALFGLVPGGPASVQVCAALRHELGFDKGMSLATIVDNQGSRYKVHPVDVDEAKHLIFNAHQGLLSGGGVGAQRDQ